MCLLYILVCVFVSGIGLVPFRYSLDAQPGWNAGSVGYHADDGK